MYVCLYEGVRTWSYRQFLDVMCVWGIESGSSAKVVSALNYYAISPATLSNSYSIHLKIPAFSKVKLSR